MADWRATCSNNNAMLPFRKTLFPVDYSEPCVAVVPYIQEMQRHFGASLAVVHAYGPETLAGVAMVAASERRV